MLLLQIARESAHVAGGAFHLNSGIKLLSGGSAVCDSIGDGTNSSCSTHPRILVAEFISTKTCILSVLQGIILSPKNLKCTNKGSYYPPKI